MQKSKINSHCSSAVLLAMGSLIGKVIGAIYRIPLTNLLGAEGLGIYQTVFPLFTILLTLSSGGITQAISALLSSCDDNEKYGVIKAGLSQVGVLSLFIGSLTFILAPVFATIQGSTHSTIGYQVLAPVIVLSGFSSLIKGYFQSKSNFFPTEFSALIEQVVKLVFGLGLAYYYSKTSVYHAVFGALLGSLIGEIGCVLYLFIKYIFDKDRPKPLSVNPPKYDFLRVFRAVLPLSLGGLILPICALFDSVSIINILSLNLPKTTAIEQYGILSGTVSTLTNLPVVFTLALGVTITPVISKEKKGSLIIQKANTSIKLGLFICIPLSLLMLALAKPITTFLYPTLDQSQINLSANLLGLSTLGITALGVTQIYSSLLYSTGLGAKSTKNLFISALIKCVLTPIALYFLGIYGACVVTVLSYFVSALLDYNSWKKVFGKNDEHIKSVSITSFFALLCISPIFILANRLNFAILIGLSALVMVLYLYTTVKFGLFSEQEKDSLPAILRPKLKKEQK